MNTKCVLFGAVMTMSLAASLVVRADGNSIGNGGDAVICQQDGQSTHQILDFFKAPRFYPLDRSLQGSDVRSTLAAVFARLSRLDANRAQFYQIRADQLLSALAHDGDPLATFTDELLQEEEDADYVSVPRHCRVRQLVFQLYQPRDEEAKFTVQKELYDSLDVLNQAGILLHEIVLEEAVAMNNGSLPSTRDVRRLVALFFSEVFNSFWMTPQFYQEYLGNLSLPVFPSQDDIRNGYPEFPWASLSRNFAALTRAVHDRGSILGVHFNQDSPLAPYAPVASDEELDEVRAPQIGSCLVENPGYGPEMLVRSNDGVRFVNLSRASTEAWIDALSSGSCQLNRGT